MTAGQTLRRRGTPLAMLALLMGGWIVLRAVTWDSPLAYAAIAKAQIPQSGSATTIAQRGPQMNAVEIPAPYSVAHPYLQGYPNDPVPYVDARSRGARYVYPPYPHTVIYGVPPSYLPRGAYTTAPKRAAPPPAIVYGYPQFPGYLPPYGQQRFTQNVAPGFRLAPHLGAGIPAKRYAVSQVARPPSTVPISAASHASNDRWMLDAYGFYRQGSSALSVSQGRQPIYGASQIAANLQWRARPSSGHDPRVYARAYQALVTGGERELAAGVSARPLGSLPVRLYGELRATQSPAIVDQSVASRTDFRPAAYAATEFPPQKIPFGLSLEAYGAGGYVGGDASTYFVDGQAVLASPTKRIGQRGIGTADVSIGAGVWGGAQKGVSRVDVGPTLRFDVDIGKIPARVSVDYREKVAGDAEPDSGVAATVSTRF